VSTGSKEVLNRRTVIILGGSEDRGGRTGNVPFGVNCEKMHEPDKSMTHQCDTSTLRRGAEKGNFDLLLAQDLCIVKDGIECGFTDSRAIVFDAIDDTDATSCIGFNFIPIQIERTPYQDTSPQWI
jgi:hypothetical protein